MGKKKSAADAQTTPATKVVTKSRTKSEPKIETQPPVPRDLATEQIGIVAGLLWAQLNEQGEQSVSAIKSSLEVPADLVLAAIGWLAREDKLLFRMSGRSVLVSLR